VKKSIFLFVLLFSSFIFVGCADVPDFPSNRQFTQILSNKQDFIVTGPIYFCKGKMGSSLAYFYPEFEYVNKFGNKIKFEFNYICKGYYKNTPDSIITIFVKMFRRKDMISDNFVDHLKIVWEM